MRQFSIFNFQFPISKGFTLIELIVVFSVMAIISTVGIASFASYNNSQKLKNAALDMKTMLQQARSQASSQVKPNACGVFQGYEVRVCCVSNGTNCPTCLASGDYELDAVCSSSPNGVLINSTKLVGGVSVDTADTTARSFLFIPITGGVAQGGKVVLQGANSAKQTITVTSTGVIQ